MKAVNVEEVATKKVYQQFDEAERKHIADNTPGWRWCMAPGCRAGHVLEGQPTTTGGSSENQGKAKLTAKKKNTKTTNSPRTAPDVDIWTCKVCGAKACVPCDRPWHQGETCKDYEARTKDRLDEEDLSLSIIQRYTRPCPNCKKPIEKDGGCSNMFCK
ncbi:hypothetical protein LTR62_007482 [Meristemomyces frigidus]|uniref:RBR-type E3 ubiquitin transferase n=1 Tax=Meristemomyces frigidus TaxID=1508187 RepID=A0AAN7TBK1_9PEZI|nr:hypothetical protein LTR62_007482 [Meristemomyces frigidus]